MDIKNVTEIDLLSNVVSVCICVLCMYIFTMLKMAHNFNSNIYPASGPG